MRISDQMVVGSGDDMDWDERQRSLAEASEKAHRAKDWKALYREALAEMPDEIKAFEPVMVAIGRGENEDEWVRIYDVAYRLGIDGEQIEELTVLAVEAEEQK